MKSWLKSKIIILSICFLIALVLFIFPSQIFGLILFPLAPFCNLFSLPHYCLDFNLGILIISIFLWIVLFIIMGIIFNKIKSTNYRILILIIIVFILFINQLFIPLNLLKCIRINAGARDTCIIGTAIDTKNMDLCEYSLDIGYCYLTAIMNLMSMGKIPKDASICEKAGNYGRYYADSCYSNIVELFENKNSICNKISDSFRREECLISNVCNEMSDEELKYQCYRKVQKVNSEKEHSSV